MSYISLSDKDKKEMLARLGLSSMKELFTSIPDSIKLNRDLNIPDSKTESELVSHFKDIADRNTDQHYLSFLGAGAYPHVIPSVVDYLASRGEFVSPYTPYQPEVSQGTLQIIFEFQTLICQLTGMDIANASLYDGASGAAEAVLMAHRLRRKPKVLLAGLIHPQYKEVIHTYTRNLGIQIEEVGFSSDGFMDDADLQKKIDTETSVVIAQSPNFIGVIEDLESISKTAHANGALSAVVISEPVSLGLLDPPGNLGADIVTGEAQSFGIPQSFGGPFLGFMACSKEFIRQFPGRIAGETVDVEGKRGFVLTLSTREQHIRRERATSNICTNQALCALRATIFLETMGKEGIRELAWHNVQKANYALEECVKISGIEQKFSGAFFNEFVLEFGKPVEDVNLYLKEQGITGGLDLEKFYPELKNCALFCVTEIHSKENIDRLVSKLKEALNS
ncbi:MAG: aminomethyl-transferring glycine dehydrogenase subunit GcvPA [Candidatus Aminicenantes bacterium]|nr:aminomethyl-transferring glycine dehydrogenase subunit GcvPA [Candidatus Aminicenantes bacterium]